MLPEGDRAAQHAILFAMVPCGRSTGDCTQVQSTRLPCAVTDERSSYSITLFPHLIRCCSTCVHTWSGAGQIWPGASKLAGVGPSFGNAAEVQRKLPSSAAIDRFRSEFGPTPKTLAVRRLEAASSATSKRRPAKLGRLWPPGPVSTKFGPLSQRHAPMIGQKWPEF